MVQVKLPESEFSKAFSKINVNSSIKYAFVLSTWVGSSEATKVMRRVLAEIRVCNVGQVICGVVDEGGV